MSAHWSQKDYETARRLIKDGASNETCLEVLGRTRKACETKVLYGKAPNSKIPYAPRRGDSATQLPDEVVTEAKARWSAPRRDISAIVFGDPPVGYSALERRS
jgi:hypothetical protein